GDGGAEAHVENDLLEARNLVRVLVAELLRQRGDDVLRVLVGEARGDDLGGRNHLLLRRRSVLSAALLARLLPPLLGARLLLGLPAGHDLPQPSAALAVAGVGISSPLLARRTLLPFASVPTFTRVPLPVFGSTGMTLHARIGCSRSRMPPCGLRG